MPYEFQVLCDPPRGGFAELESLFPANVFCTHAYARAMGSIGRTVCIIGVRVDGYLKTGCLATFQRGRLSRSLEITSVPPLNGAEKSFWSGLRKYCVDSQITELGVYSFGSPSASIPRFGREMLRNRRVEFVLDLDGGDVWSKLDKKHRQSLKKARQANLLVRSSTDPAALDEHLRLMALSLERHANKGESTGDSGDAAVLRALLHNGAARLYQVIAEGRTLSSATVLRSNAGAYYHTAGNHPDGLAVGASHFLLYEIASELSRDAVAEFNLGGTDPANEGLVRFKTRFGARTVELEAASFYLGSELRRRIVAASRGLRAALR